MVVVKADEATGGIIQKHKYQVQSRSNIKPCSSSSLVNTELCQVYFPKDDSECWIPWRLLRGRGDDDPVPTEVLQDEDTDSEEEDAEEMCDMAFAEDDETPRQIARKYKVPLLDLMKLNRDRYEGFNPDSELKEGTTVLLPSTSADASDTSEDSESDDDDISDREERLGLVSGEKRPRGPNEPRERGEKRSRWGGGERRG